MVPRNETDEALMRAYQQTGDEAAFKALYDRYYEALGGFIARLLEGPLTSDVDDTRQQVFLEFHATRQRFTRGMSVKPFLFKLAQRRSTDHKRRALAQKRDHRRVTDTLVEIEDDDSHRQIVALVNDLIASLPAENAEAVRLVWLENHTAKSAAELLGVPVTTVQWRVREGLRQLRE